MSTEDLLPGDIVSIGKYVVSKLHILSVVYTACLFVFCLQTVH